MVWFNVRRVLLAVLLLGVLTPCAFGAVTSVSISPSNPEQGDVLRINIEAAPGEDVAVSLDYSGDAPVSGGEYEIILYDVVIPKKPNRFSARVSGVDNLIVRVKRLDPLPLPWLGIQKDANDNGVASLSQSGIPAGTYHIKVLGDALNGRDSIDLSFSADITLTMDSDGEYSYSYDTSNIPPGTIVVDVGGETDTITLRSSGGSGGGSSGGGVVVPSPDADFTVSGERLVGEVLSFDASDSEAGTGYISSYGWSYGDGETGSGVRSSHVFSEPGEYQIRLTIKNSYNVEDTKSLTLVVEEIPNSAPVVSGGGIRGCLVGHVLGFSSQSSDPDGMIVEYLWDFGDGVTGSGKRVEHSWGSSGSYVVNHTVVDDRGASASVYYSVEVEDVDVVLSREVIIESSLFQYFGDFGASITGTGNNTRLYLFEHGSNPGGVSLPLGQMGAILDIVVADPDSVTWPLYFEVDYDSGLVDNVTETSLGLYYFSDGVWGRCVRTGVDVERGVVWANLTRGELTGSPLTIGVIEPLPYYSTHSVSLSSSRFEEGEPVSVVFNVTNSGDRSGNLVSLVYLDDEAVASRTVHLEAGESKLVTVSFPAPMRGMHLVRVGDDMVSLTVTPPTVSDLVCFVESNATLVEPGDVVSIRYLVANQGNRTAAGFACVLTVDGLRVSSTRVDELVPGGNESWVYDWIIDGEGEFSVVYSVDVDAVVFELVEENNSDSLVLVSERPFPVMSVIVVVFFGLVGFYFWRNGSIDWFIDNLQKRY